MVSVEMGLVAPQSLLNIEKGHFCHLRNNFLCWIFSAGSSPVDIWKSRNNIDPKWIFTFRYLISIFGAIYRYRYPISPNNSTWRNLGKVNRKNVRKHRMAGPIPPCTFWLKGLETVITTASSDLKGLVLHPLPFLFLFLFSTNKDKMLIRYFTTKDS